MKWVEKMWNKLWFWMCGIKVYNGFIIDPHDPEYEKYKEKR